MREKRTSGLMSGNVETEYGRNIVALTDERVRNRENKPRPNLPRHFPTLPGF